MALAAEILHDDPPAPTASNAAISPGPRAHRPQGAREGPRPAPPVRARTAARPGGADASRRRRPPLRRRAAARRVRMSWSAPSWWRRASAGWWTVSRLMTEPPRFAARDWVLVADFDEHDGPRRPGTDAARGADPLAPAVPLRQRPAARARRRGPWSHGPADRRAGGRRDRAGSRPPRKRGGGAGGRDHGRRQPYLVTVKGLAVPDGRTLFVESEVVTADGSCRPRSMRWPPGCGTTWASRWSRSRRAVRWRR